MPASSASTSWRPSTPPIEIPVAQRREPPPALPEPGACRGQARSDEPDGREQPADAEDRAHDRRACVVDALVADRDRCQLADEEQRGAGQRQEETDVRATARAGEAAAREAEHSDEDEHVQERPQDRHGDERAAREGVAPHLVRDAWSPAERPPGRPGRRSRSRWRRRCRRWLRGGESRCSRSPCRPRFQSGGRSSGCDATSGRLACHRRERWTRTSASTGPGAVSARLAVRGWR